jgi:uncharacterized protein YabE (DUF348 family)
MTNKFKVFHRFFATRSPLFLAVVFLGFFGLIFLTAVGVMALTKNRVADDDAGRSYHAITFYDNDIETTIITSATTVAEALRDADIAVAGNDSITPAPDANLTEAVMVVNIRRARPVVVVDGGHLSQVVTPAMSPTDIATAAGVKLYPEDEAEIAPIENFLLADGAGLEMNITRAKLVNLRLYGQELALRTRAANVAELLNEKKIKLGPDDGMNLAPTDKITNNMLLQIWRNGIQTITATEIVPFTTKTIKDPTRNVGFHEIQTAGQNGEKTMIYDIEMRDNVEVNRKILSEVVNRPAVEQIEIVGTKVNLPPGGHEDWMRVAGISSSDYGYVNYIFSHESGWRTDARNPSGKYVGLGQTNPNSLAGACPNWQSDPICQIQFFDGYARARYGSWAGAYDFWQGHSWW